MDDAAFVTALVTASATVGLALFAAVQMWHLRSEHRARVRAAYSASWAEYWRLYTVSQGWEPRELINRARLGLLDPEELSPPDWAGMLAHISQLGPFATRLAGSGYSLAALAVQSASVLRRLAEECELRMAAEVSSEGRQKVLAQRMPSLTDRATKASELAREAAEVFEDALRQAPSWLRTVKFDPMELQSSFGVKLARQVVETEKSASWVGRRRAQLGDRLRRLAQFCDPPRNLPIGVPHVVVHASKDGGNAEETG